MNYVIKYSRLAIKDKENLQGVLYEKAKNIIDLLRENPFKSPPPYEKLTGNLDGMYSRRLNNKHRIWYSVDKTEKVVRILRMWTHYA